MDKNTTLLISHDPSTQQGTLTEHLRERGFAIAGLPEAPRDEPDEPDELHQGELHQGELPTGRGFDTRRGAALQRPARQRAQIHCGGGARQVRPGPGHAPGRLDGGRLLREPGRWPRAGVLRPGENPRRQGAAVRADHSDTSGGAGRSRPDSDQLSGGRTRADQVEYF